jgi:CheY-like chemotaxis protein
MSRKVSVLVVEDEALIRLQAVTQLEAEGCEVFEASNADQAIDLLEAEPSINILFTDIDMPGSMDGLKLAAAVHDRWPPVKIIVTSGHRAVAPSDIPDGGVFFSKPYVHRAVLQSMHQLLAA